jgi:hypothetical protein
MWDWRSLAALLALTKVDYFLSATPSITYKNNLY